MPTAFIWHWFLKQHSGVRLQNHCFSWGFGCMYASTKNIASVVSAKQGADFRNTLVVSLLLQAFDRHHKYCKGFVNKTLRSDARVA